MKIPLWYWLSIVCMSLAQARGMAQAPVLKRRVNLFIRVLERNAAPVPYVSVKASHGAHTHSHRADGKGLVSFTLEPELLNIQVSAVGYAPFTGQYQVLRDTTVIITLVEQAVNKGVVEVTETLKRDQAITSQGVGEQNLRSKQGALLGEILTQLSGVSLLRTGVSVAKPVIHGLSGQRILIMNAGIKQEGQQWGNEHAPEIDPYMADSLVLVKGAAGVQYGPDAIGGVITVEPRQPRYADGIGGAVHTAGFTNNGMGTGSVMLEGAKTLESGKVYARMQGSGRYAGDSRTPEYVLVNTAFRELNGSAQLGFKGKKWFADLFGSQFQTSLGIFTGAHIGNLEDLKNALERQRPNTTGDFDYSITRPSQDIVHQLARLNAGAELSELWQWRMTLGAQQNNRKEYDVVRGGSSTPQLDFTLTTYNADNWFQYAKAGGTVRKIGATALYQTNTWEGRFLIPNFINQGLGAYAFESHKVGGVTLEAGLRYDWRQMEAFFNNRNVIRREVRQWHGLAASAGIVHHPFYHVTWSHHLGYAWRPPTVNELYSNGIHHGAAAIERGDANLNAEAGLKLTSRFQYEHDGLKVEATAYGQYFSNFIYMVPRLPAELTVRGAFPVFGYTQVPAMIYGLDLDARQQLTEKMAILVSGALCYGQQTGSTTTPLLWMPPARLRVTLGHELWRHNAWTLNGQVSWQAVARQSLAPDSLDYAPAPAGYSLWGAGLSLMKQTPAGTLQVSISGENLLDTQYRDYLNRFRYYANEPGRNVILRVSIPFTLLSSES